jgi:hypothetical protein
MEKTIMNKFCAVLIVASGLLTFAARAQVTNVTFTELETFEAQTGKVIVKGAGQIGSMTIDSINLTVICKESTDVSTGLKKYGVAVEISANNQRGVKMLVDYDEMDSLLNGINYLAQIDSNVTTLPTFVASYVTKSGLRVGAYTSQRRGAIQFFLQDRSFDSPRILMTSAQLAEFQNLMEQAKKNLDSLRAGG